MKKEYERFGSEWEKEMSKIPKKLLIRMLKKFYIKEASFDIKNKIGNHKSPFGIGA